MITVEPTTDRGYILSVLTEPEMYAAVSDERCPSAGVMAEALVGPSVHHLKVTVDSEPAGLFSYVDYPGGEEFHASLTEKCRGRKAVEAGLKAVKFVKALGRPVTAAAKKDLRHAHWYARQIGFTTTGRDERFVYFKL